MSDEKQTFDGLDLVDRSRATSKTPRFVPPPHAQARTPLASYGFHEAREHLYQRAPPSSRSPVAGQPYSAAYTYTSKETKHHSSSPGLAQDAFRAAQSGIAHLMSEKDEAKRPTKLKRTAYLDGLRGFGAFLVYVLHNEGWAHATTVENSLRLEHGWGFKGHYDFVAFPLIRTFFSGGHFAVALFLVISGYVLAAKPLGLMQARDTIGLAENLCSALFRRWMRLFIPVAVLTFLWMTSWHLLGIRSSGTVVPERTYFDEVRKWYYDFKNYSFIFNDSWFNAYSFHVWTIPLEFRGSIVVYTTCMALARCNTVTRLRVEGALIWYFVYIVDGWYCALFVIGMLLCDMDLLAMRNELPTALSRLRTQPTWVYYMILLLALFLGGVTSIGSDIMDLRQTPGWYLLSFLKPQAMLNYAWYYRIWASTLLMLCIPRIRWLQSFFETSFCQYLGRISFGLYLVHGPIMWTIGDRIYAAVGLVRESHHALVPWWINRYPFPSSGIYGLEVNFLLAQLILLPLTFWVAEVFTRVVDEPSVRFAQWLLKQHTSTARAFVV